MVQQALPQAAPAKVIAFVGDEQEPFWLGEEVEVVGSSRSQRVLVNWYAKVGGYYALEGLADLMGLDQVVTDNVELSTNPDGKMVLATADEAAIMAALSQMDVQPTPDPGL